MQFYFSNYGSKDGVFFRATFLYIRMMKDPSKYLKIVGKERSKATMERKLEDLCVRSINSLVAAGLVTMDDSTALAAKEAGRLERCFF